MRRCVFLILTLIFALPLKAEQPTTVIIGVDGLGASGFERAKTPEINKLKGRGLFSTTARAVFKTSSGPNWASILSGVGPEQHGVLDNAWRPGKSPIPPTVTNDIGGFMTIMNYVEQKYPNRPRIAIYGWDQFDYLLGDASMEKQYFAVDDGSDHEEHLSAIKATNDTAVAAVQALKKQPAFLFIHFDIVDHALHAYGVDSAEYIESIELVDTNVGRILETVGDKDTVILTADHGGKNDEHGGFTVSEQEVPMIVSGPRIPGGQRLQVPIDVYDATCTALDAMGIERPMHMICKSLLDPALLTYKVREAPFLVPRPGVHEDPSDLKKITITVDHPKARIYYRASKDMEVGDWKLYSKPLSITRPARIETRSKLGEHFSRTYAVDLLTSQNGVRADLMVGKWSKLPDLATLTPVASFDVPDFTLEKVPYPKEYFGVRFQTRFYAPVDGTYTFRIKVDDGGSLFVNGNRLAYEPEPKGSRFAQGSIELKAGFHQLDARYYQTYGSIAFNLDMKTPRSDEFQPLPATSLYLPEQ